MFENKTLKKTRLTHTIHQKNKPCVVFLHGLLGSAKDWFFLSNELKKINSYSCLALDLPGHGQQKNLELGSLDTVLFYLRQQLKALNQPYWLVGYSLGARLAMQYAINWGGKGFDPHLKGLILESGHTGLPVAMRQARLLEDERWASRFEREKMCDLLQDWYQQGVFSSLNTAQKQSLIKLRSDNLGEKIATLLRLVSLGKQGQFNQALGSLPFPVHLICGQKDEKFCALAKASGLTYHLIKNAGHNVHYEQAKHMAHLIDKLIKA